MHDVHRAHLPTGYVRCRTEYRHILLHALRAMPDRFNTSLSSVTRTIGTPIWWAVVVLLALLTIAAALIVAAVSPALNGQVIIAVVGLLIIFNAVIVSIAMPLVANHRVPATSDDPAYR
jgi:hypothetical protein